MLVFQEKVEYLHPNFLIHNSELTIHNSKLLP